MLKNVHILGTISTYGEQGTLHWLLEKVRNVVYNMILQFTKPFKAQRILYLPSAVTLTGLVL